MSHNLCNLVDIVGRVWRAWIATLLVDVLYLFSWDERQCYLLFNLLDVDEAMCEIANGALLLV